jgi:hypothetical protein
VRHEAQRDILRNKNNYQTTTRRTRLSLTYREVLNAFQPAKEITDVRKFAGRTAQMERAIHGLLTEGAHLFVYGQRGIGKSSFARQIASISAGEGGVLRALNLRKYEKEKPDFLSIAIVCDDSVKSIEDLLLRALTDPDGLAPWVQHEELKKTIEDVREFAVRPGGVGAQSKHTEKVEAEKRRQSITGAFIAAVRNVVKSRPARDGLLLTVDEFDRIGDRSGIASVLKSLADCDFKCLIVGVADGLESLVVDHASLQRQMAEGAVRLEPMDKSERIEVIRKVEAVLKGEYSFQESTAERIADLSMGQPYLIHLFGKAALQQAYSEQSSTVADGHLQEALKKIAVEGYEAALEERYRQAVASSPPREQVLRAFASVSTDKIHSSEAYRLCPDVDQPAVYVGHLRQDKYGAELLDRGNRYHEFRDALFKAYVNATPARFLPAREAS